MVICDERNGAGLNGQVTTTLVDVEAMAVSSMINVLHVWTSSQSKLTRQTLEIDTASIAEQVPHQLDHGCDLAGAQGDHRTATGLSEGLGHIQHFWLVVELGWPGQVEKTCTRIDSAIAQ